MHKDCERILISEEQIKERVKELAAMLDKDYENKNPLLVCILKGSVMFFTDLARAMQIPINLEFMSISSYGNGATSGIVKLVKDVDKSIENRDVIIVEDIIDTGNTLFYLRKLLMQRKPSSVKICALLDKYERREAEIDPDYTGFKIENEFVIGYGLDYAERYRNLPYIGVLKRDVYE